MRKTKEEALQTRCNLLTAALDVFYERGVAQASLEEIAQTAGVTRGALYWHFKNKEDLFDALFQLHSGDIEQHLAQAKENFDGSDPLTLLKNGILEHFHRLANDAALQKFSTILYLRCEQTESNRSIVDLVHKYHQRWNEQMIEVINLSKQQGQLPENLNSQYTLISLVSPLVGLTLKWLSEPNSFNLPQLADIVIEIFLKVSKPTPHYWAQPIETAA